MSNEHISTKETRQLLGVTAKTLRVWVGLGKIRAIKTPAGINMYNKQDVHAILGIDDPPKEKKKIAYCRVSSRKQLDDLERQKEFFKVNYPNYTVVFDVASGLNWSRKGFNSILDGAIKGDIEEVMVAHRDRLCRFAFELIQSILEKTNTKLTVLERHTFKSKSEELTDDILSIVHVYSCREMGKRRYANKENSSLSNNDSEEKTETVDGNDEVCVQ